MTAHPRDFQVVTADHLPLGASEWRYDGEARGRNVVVIASATSANPAAGDNSNGWPVLHRLLTLVG